MLFSHVNTTKQGTSARGRFVSEPYFGRNNKILFKNYEIFVCMQTQLISLQILLKSIRFVNSVCTISVYENKDLLTKPF